MEPNGGLRIFFLSADFFFTKYLMSDCFDEIADLHFKFYFNFSYSIQKNISMVIEMQRFVAIWIRKILFFKEFE